VIKELKQKQAEEKKMKKEERLIFDLARKNEYF